MAYFHANGLNIVHGKLTLDGWALVDDDWKLEMEDIDTYWTGELLQEYSLESDVIKFRGYRSVCPTVMRSGPDEHMLRINFGIEGFDYEPMMMPWQQDGEHCTCWECPGIGPWDELDAAIMMNEQFDAFIHNV